MSVGQLPVLLPPEGHGGHAVNDDKHRRHQEVGQDHQAREDLEAEQEPVIFSILQLFGRELVIIDWGPYCVNCGEVHGN